MHFDSHGSGTVHALSMVGKENSPNPFTSKDLDRVLNSLHKDLKDFPEWVKTQDTDTIAIGTSMSIFNQMRVLSGLNQFFSEDVMNVLSQCLSRNDKELHDLETEKWNQNRTSLGGEYSLRLENALYIIPKLSLLLSVMRKAELENVRYFEANGNCAALLTD